MLLKSSELGKGRIRIDRLFLAWWLGFKAQRLRCSAGPVVSTIIAIVAILAVAAILAIIVAITAVALLWWAATATFLAGLPAIATCLAIALSRGGCRCMFTAIAAVVVLGLILPLSLTASMMRPAIAVIAGLALIVVAPTKPPKQHRFRLYGFRRDHFGTWQFRGAVGLRFAST